MRQAEETEGVEPVLDGNKNNVRVLGHKVGAFLRGLSRAAHLIGTAVDPHHDWLLLIARVNSLPYVQVQAILALGILGSLLICIAHLAGHLSEVICLVHAIIRLHIHRSLPAVFPHGLRTDIRNAFVRDDIVICLFAHKCTVDALHGQRRIVIAVGDRLILSICCAYFCHILFRRLLRSLVTRPLQLSFTLARRYAVAAKAGHRQHQCYCHNPMVNTFHDILPPNY